MYMVQNAACPAILDTLTLQKPIFPAGAAILFSLQLSLSLSPSSYLSSVSCPSLTHSRDRTKKAK